MTEKCKAVIDLSNILDWDEFRASCELEQGHAGKHRKEGLAYGKKYTIEWEDKVDEPR